MEGVTGNYILMNDMIGSHRERITNLKRYYPFFKLMDLGFGQFGDGSYESLDMGYILMAVLRFMIEYNHFRDLPVSYENYAEFTAMTIRRDFGLEPEEGLIRYIFDKLCNDGRPFEFTYFDPQDKQRKTLRTRLIESEPEGGSVVYRITSDAVGFYLDTKEVKDESRINIAQLLLSKLIRSGDFTSGLEVISRINMEVGRLMQQQKEIKNLLTADVREGLKALDAYMSSLFKWFDEEQRLFASNMELSARMMEKLETGHEGGDNIRAVKALDGALKEAMTRHAQLMKLCLEMQKQGDEALQKAKRTRFRTVTDFKDLGRRIMDTDDASILTMLVLPLMAPKLQKTFPLTRTEELLLYQPEEKVQAEKIRKEKERNYVYEDDLVSERMDVNFRQFMRVLFDRLLNKDSLTLEHLNYIYGVKFTEEVYSNGDYYAFLTHLCRKDSYDLSFPEGKSESFLEDEMRHFIEDGNEKYRDLKFRLIFLPEEQLTIRDRYTISNIRFERM